jgi:hypothetical protein
MVFWFFVAYGMNKRNQKLELNLMGSLIGEGWLSILRWFSPPKLNKVG